MRSGQAIFDPREKEEFLSYGVYMQQSGYEVGASFVQLHTGQKNKTFEIYGK
jgi:hypothetical protein